MQRFVPFFIPIAASFVLAGAVLAWLDVMHIVRTAEPRTSDASLVLVASWLCGALAASVGLLSSVLLVLVSPAAEFVRSKLATEELPAEDALAWWTRLVVAPSGTRWWAWPASLLPFVVGFVVTPLGRPVVASLGLTNVWVTVANAVWSTMAFVVPLLVHRLVCRRWPAWSGRESVVWATVAFWAHYITTSYWMSASPFTLFGALPLMLLPAGAAAFALYRYSPRVAKGMRWAALVMAVASLVTLVAYPDRSGAHAQMSKGITVGTGAWQLLAKLSDLDGDGATSFIGGLDCDALDFERRPSHIEIVGNGVDDNCFGGELPTYEPRMTAITPPDAGRRPPVILITIDTLRADALGRVVDGKRVTPELDNLLQHSVHFTNAYSTAAGTDESIPALMTGMYPSDWHQYGIYFGVEPTLAELLGGIGYQSRAVVLLPWLRAALIHGFDVIDNSLGEIHLREAQELTAPESTRLALQYIDERDQERPLFLWVHYYDVHLPRSPVPELESWLGKNVYAQQAHMVDNAVADFFVGLEERGMLNSSVIILASDHGEAMGEHKLQTHGWAVWQSIVRIPVSMRLPGIKSRPVDTPISLVDVAPTLLDYLGFGGFEGRDGRSLMPLLKGGELPHRPIFIEAEIDDRPALFSVIDNDLKLIVDLPRAAYHLYDLKADPREADNLIDQRPEDADRLLGILGQWRDSVFNEVRLDRKRALWEERSKWKPEKLITRPDSFRTDENLAKE